VSKEILTQPTQKQTDQAESRQSHEESPSSRQTGHARILQLHRTLGNRKVAELIRAKRLTVDGRIVRVQRKLTVGAADDQYEQEAERTARQVVSTPESALKPASPEPGNLVRLPAKSLPVALEPTGGHEAEKTEGLEEEVEEKEASLQRSSVDGNDAFEAGSAMETLLDGSRWRGSPLPDHVRAYMEPRFGAGFGNVRQAFPFLEHIAGRTSLPDTGEPCRNWDRARSPL
jgi:hypothetical protein